MPTIRSGLWLWLGLMLVLLTVTLWRFPAEQPLQYDLLSLLPETGDAAEHEAARSLAAPFENTTIWVIGADTQAEAVAAGQALFERLTDMPELAPQAPGDNRAAYEALIERLHPYRWQLLTQADAEAVDDDPERWIERQLARQYGLIGALSGRTLRTDPFGHFGRYLQPLQVGLPDAQMVDGLPLVQHDSRYFVILQAPVTAAGYDLGDSGLLDFWQNTGSWAEAQDWTLIVGGVPFYTAYGVESGEREVRLIGGLSLLAIVLLLVWRFRAVRPLLVTLLVVSVGIASGAAATLTVFGHLHLLTLVFGVTVIGAAVDYAFHYLADSLRPGWQPLAGIRGILPSLRLALLSSVLAFLSLTLAPFPALRQAAVFMAAGLIGAWLTVVLLLPALVRPARRARPPAPWQPATPWRLRWLVPALLVLCLPGWLLLEPVDDVRLLYTAPPALQADEVRLAAMLEAPQGNRFLLLRQQDGESLLAKAAALKPVLSRWQEDGIIGGWQSLTDLVPSAEQQLANRARFEQLADSAAVAQYLTHLGFADADIDAVVADIRQDRGVLTPEQILPWLDLRYQALWLGCGERDCRMAVRLGGVTEPAAIRNWAGEQSGISFVDTVGDINAALQHYRHVSLVMLALALLAAGLVLTVALGWRRGLRVLAVPALAMLSSLAVIGYLGAMLSLFNLLALLLVLGVGIDYALFYHCARPDGRSSAALAIGMAVLTTALAFGLLAFSQTPVISAFGVTLLPGLLVAWLLALLTATSEGETDKESRDFGGRL